jgi:hypothetical protein
MKKFHLTDKIKEEETKPQRKHCPDCCYFLDGKKLAHPTTGKQVFSPMAGMRYAMWTTGTIYEKIGTLIPCLCASGSLVEQGYQSKDYIYKSKKRIAVYNGRELERGPEVEEE